MMFIFGFFWGWVNIGVAWGYLSFWTEDRHSRSGGTNAMIDFLSIFIAVPVAAFLCIMPFFGGWIVTPIVQQVCLSNCYSESVC